MPLPLSVGLPDADEQVGTPATGSTLTPDSDQTNDKDMGAPMPMSTVDPARVAARASLKLLLRNGGLLLLTLWCVSMWLFGSNYGAQNRIHRLNVLVRDLDGGAFGAALLDAVNAVNGRPDVPGFTVTESADVEHEVWKGDYWAGITANAGATEAFAALASTTESTTPPPLTWYAATARYPNAFSAYLEPALMSLLSDAERRIRARALSSSSTLSLPQITALTSPSWSFVDVGPMTFQARIFTNAFGILIATIIQFFFNATLTAIFTATGVYATHGVRALGRRKYAIKLVWTGMTALSFTSFYAIYNDTQRPGAAHFFAAWALEWAYAWVNFNTMGAVLAFVPAPFVPMVLFPIIVTSVTATLHPIELSNVVYRVSYAFPSHASWNVALTIYGAGAVNRMYIYLPVLAAWIVITEVGWVLGIRTLSRRFRKR